MKIGKIMRWRTIGLLLAMVMIVGLPYAVTLVGSHITQEASGWVAHSNAVRAQAYRIAYVIRDSESAIYRMLAGDDDPLSSKRAMRAGDAAPGLLRQLRAMTRDDPDQQALVGALEISVRGHLTLMSQAVSRLRQGNTAGARQSLRDAEDLFMMNGQIAAIMQNEDGRLQLREAVANKQAFRGRLVLTITALAQLLLLAIIVITSERQIGRRQLAETREGRAVLRSQLILQAVREPIALFDEQLRSLLVNTAFAELYAFDPELRAQPLAEIGAGAWSDPALLQRLHDVLLLDRELWDYQMRQRTADDVERHVVVNARRLPHRDHDLPALLLTVSDVTARTLVEQKVNELNHQLEGKMAQVSEVNRELEAFSYSVSHDLRAPLRHITGFTERLEQHLGEAMDDKARHYLSTIANSAQRMAALIDDLLVFSRLGRGALRLRAVDMQSLVEETRAMTESEQEDRRIVWSIAALPVVIGDENMLRTVWQNLIGNAVKYTGQREVARITISVQQADCGDYEFTVSDNGAGFDMQYADKLFGVFQRLHRNSDFPGSGIGLANVRRIVLRHGGRVWAEGKPGEGARFHFSLPATDAAGIRA
jgi:signal transduction histidine kinase